MRLKIWNSDTVSQSYGTPPPPIDFELGGGDVIQLEDNIGNVLFYIEVGNDVKKI